MRNDDDLMYLAGMMNLLFDEHGYNMDAPDRSPIGATSKIWYNDKAFSLYVIR